jgi:hypothetical protein
MSTLKPRQTQPLQRGHYTMLDTDELARVYDWRNQRGDRQRQVERWRVFSLYAGAIIVILALTLAIVVLARA